MAGESLADLSKLGIYGDILSHRDYPKAIAKLDYVAIKQSVFPFIKFKGIDVVLGPEMRSTGEVMGIDRSPQGGFYRAQIASSNSLPQSGTVFFSIRDADKEEGAVLAKLLLASGFQIVATKGTASFLKARGLPVETVNKVREGSPHIVDRLKAGGICMVVNTPEGSGPHLDSRTIRSKATELRLPLFTTIAAAEAAIESIAQVKKGAPLAILS